MSDTYAIQRPASEQLVDLHVYLLPREVWNDKYRSSFNESISEAQSAGFVRVWPELTVNGLRMVIEEELGHDILPYNYVFLRSVGRCMTQVKPKQEFELKCKAFLPPAAWSPEIVVLERPQRDDLASGYSSFDATQSVNGMNHDRMVPVEGPSHLMQQAVKEDPYGQGQAVAGGGFPHKSGRPDAYTNNTNEDSGISEPAPEEYDPEFERRNAGADSHYYNQLPPNHPHQRQFNEQQHSHQPQETGSREEEQRAEQRRREEEEEEERRKEQESIAEKRREEERRARERAASEERRKEQEKQKHEQRKKDEGKTRQKKKEEERRHKGLEEARQHKLAEQQRLQEEAERRVEEERQAKIQERTQAEREMELAARMNEEPMAYDDAVSRASTNMETGVHGGRVAQGFPTDSQLQSRAEQELRDYEPQSTWPEDQGRGSQRHPSEGHGSIGATPSRQRQRRLSDRDSNMETGDAVQQAMQDGLKRVHLTPEVHRKAKIGKVRNGSTADEEEDMYEVDPKMAELIEHLEAARQERQEKEQERENMIKKAKGLQAKTSERRNKGKSHPANQKINQRMLQEQARDYWKKRYFDEKKSTIPMEEEVTKLRHQLEIMHRKLMSHLEGKKGKNASVKGPPSKKNDHKIAILKLQHDVEEIKRQVDNARMKLTSEVKLRNQAEQEVRSLKSEVTQKKINLTLTRNQKMAALKLGDSKLVSKTSPRLPGPSTGPLPPSAKTL